ncbi:amino acid ABC transporter permease [Nocardioidaceae bacterium]|nr:amino acid ABC transporter permease [Nocardioidaceae bacterium]
MSQPPEAAWVPSPAQRDRDAYRRRRSRRDASVATLATVVLLGGLALVVVSSPGWPRVQSTFFSGFHFAASWRDVLSAFWVNVSMFLIAEPIILVLALLIAVVRGTRAPVLFPVRLLAVLFTDMLRGIPTILLVLLLGFGMPALGLQGVPTSLYFWALTALVLSYSAYVAEVLRAGIESIHPSQIASARTLGLSRTQTLRHVIVPQGVRRVIPPLLNDFVSLQKDTALVSVVAIFDAVYTARDYGAYNFNYTPYVVAALLFIALTVPLARFTDWLSARARRREVAGSW